MNDYELYMCCNIVLENLAKYQGKCMERLQTLRQELHDCNLHGFDNSQITQKIIAVEGELTNIQKALIELTSKRATLLTTMQDTDLQMQEKIDFGDLKY